MIGRDKGSAPARLRRYLEIGNPDKAVEDKPAIADIKSEYFVPTELYFLGKNRNFLLY